MIAIIFGLITIVLGGYGIYAWLSDFFVFLKGLIPISLIFGGLISVLAGISSLKK